MKALALALVFVGLGWPLSYQRVTPALPKKDAAPRRQIQPSVDVFYCVPTDAGRTCRSGADVASFLRGDDRECH